MSDDPCGILTDAELDRLEELSIEVTPDTWHFNRQADAEYVCALHNAYPRFKETIDALRDLMMKRLVTFEEQLARQQHTLAGMLVEAERERDTALAALDALRAKLAAAEEDRAVDSQLIESLQARLDAAEAERDARRDRKVTCENLTAELAAAEQRVIVAVIANHRNAPVWMGLSRTVPGAKRLAVDALLSDDLVGRTDLDEGTCSVYFQELARDHPGVVDPPQPGTVSYWGGQGIDELLRDALREERRSRATEAVPLRLSAPTEPENTTDDNRTRDIEERDDLIAIRRDIDALAPKENA